MRNIGFSSGALSYGDFQGALDLLRDTPLACIELSALRVSELQTLIDAIPYLHLAKYKYISFHAPSNFTRDEEQWVSDMLFEGVPESWPIVIHPDTIGDFSCWRRFGSRLAVENMDRRKPIGRTASELHKIFDLLPDASLCFDIGHARQCDASMTEAFLILSEFRAKLVQVHISEVNSASQHDSISNGAQIAFQEIAGLIPSWIPVVVESRVLAGKIAHEISRAMIALTPQRELVGLRNNN